MRPVVRRLELLALVCYAGAGPGGPPGEPRGGSRRDHTSVFLHAGADQVRAALAVVAEALHEPLRPARAADVRRFVEFLADFPEPHTGTLTGLAEKTVRWQRARLAEVRERVRLLYGAQAPAALPPIPLPDEPGVRFLDTVGAVCAEGERMQHCAAVLAEQVVLGSCYLFHVDHRGDEATVEVGREGRVRQARGPGNVTNAAARWGRSVLGRWAAGFPEPTQRAGPGRGLHAPLAEEDVPF